MIGYIFGAGAIGFVIGFFLCSAFKVGKQSDI